MAKQVPGRNGGTLTRPEKGEVLNPKGRTKGSRGVKKILKMLLDAEIDVEEAGELLRISKKQAMLLLLVNRATDEDEDPEIQMKASKMVLDRLQGKPKQPVQHSGDKDNPLTLSPTIISVTYRSPEGATSGQDEKAPAQSKGQKSRKEKPPTLPSPQKG